MDSMPDRTEVEAEPSLSTRAAVLHGARRCLGVPALGIGLSMMGFGAVAHDLGFTAPQTIATTALVWGLPGQLAYMELATAGAPVLVVMAAVAFANMRMLPMVVTGLPLILGGRRLGFLARVALVQFVAVTVWTQMNNDAPALPRRARLPFYLGFVTVLYTAGLSGTVIGYSGGTLLPDPALRVAVFMTPLYLLLLVSAARHPTNKLAVALGAALGLGLYPVIGDVAVLAAGLAGGTVACAAGGLLDRRRGQGEPGDG
ncbi:AzlC family ABC transporter permease [Marivibrio halodurans]|uniref:AzlC family ABC transporter permease n=1 Tax=Marivibrio halodurans TaxID=2039722 RepID=A0A8J7S4T5_9PROT|nr:AzlC family ABC transporter permease [Marivibrio halodurans]MBP5858794.1 AzlC family ABC transporter permease [Marivibrio halodurans]